MNREVSDENHAIYEPSLGTPQRNGRDLLVSVRIQIPLYLINQEALEGRFGWVSADGHPEIRRDPSWYIIKATTGNV
jgi:hypothetical protein